MAYVILFFLQISIGHKDRTGVHYTDKVKIGSSHKLRLAYNDLYPGLRYDFAVKTWMVGDTNIGSRGGCSFQDKTKLKSPLPLLEDTSDHITIGAHQGHIVEYNCNWIVPIIHEKH